MLATTITAVIFVVLLAAMRLGHRSEEKGMEREDLAQRSRILEDRLSWLMRGAYPYLMTVDGKDKLHFLGGAATLGFVTTSVDMYSGGPGDTAGLKWVEISVDGGGLKIKERAFFMAEEDIGGIEGEGEEEKETVLDPTVSSATFLYFDAGVPDEGAIEEEEETATKGQWLESWNVDEKDYLPAAIKATVALAFKGGEVDLPPIVARVRAGHRPLPAVEAE
jgi:hypothetical protein